MIELPPAADLGIPPAPAIIRPAEHRIFLPGYLPANRSARRVVLSEMRRRGEISDLDVRLAFYAAPPPIVSAGVQTFVVVGQSTAESSTADYENLTGGIGGSIQSGDLGIVTGRRHVNSGVSFSNVIPAGHTELFARHDISGNSRIRSNISVKILDGTETTVTTLSGANCVLVLRPSGFGIASFAGNASVSTGSSAAVSFTISAGTEAARPYVAVYCYTGRGNSGDTGVTTTTPAMVEIDPALNTQFGYLIVAEEEAASDIDFTTDDTFNRSSGIGGYITVTAS